MMTVDPPLIVEIYSKKRYIKDYEGNVSKRKLDNKVTYSTSKSDFIGEQCSIILSQSIETSAYRKSNRYIIHKYFAADDYLAVYHIVCLCVQWAELPLISSLT